MTNFEDIIDHILELSIFLGVDLKNKCTISK